MSWNWSWNWWRNGDDNLTGTSGRDWLFGGRGNDTIDGGGGNDFIWGGRGNDIVYGGDGNDRVFGGSGDDTLDGGAGSDRIWGGSGDDTIDGGDGNDRISGGRGDDTINGGAGSDRVYAGRGDDVGVYSVTENAGSKDYYNGGRGNDVLVLQMTQAEFDSGAVQADLAAFDAFLAENGHGGSHHGHSFKFQAFDLKVKSWESYKIEITDAGDNNAPVAENDSFFENAIVVPEVELNDDIGSAQIIDRADFRFSPTEYVGDDSLPRISIEGIVDPQSETDLYALELQAGETVILDIDFTGEPAPNPDTLIYILDANGNQLDSNDDSIDETVGGEGSHTFADSYLEFFVGTSGTYYVGVESASGLSAGPYTLQVSIANAADADQIDGLGSFLIPAATLLANDTDADMDTLSILSVGNALNGIAELLPSGDVRFKPDSEYAASFEYTVTDNNGGESTAIAAVNGNLVLGTSNNDPDLASSVGNDLFVGGDGADVFAFGPGTGFDADTITDFTENVDSFALVGDLAIDSLAEVDNGTVVNFDTGDSVLLIGVTGIDENDLFVS